MSRRSNRPGGGEPAGAGVRVAEVTGRQAPRLVTPMWLARAVAPFAHAGSRLVGKQPIFTWESLHALRNHRDIRRDKATRELDYQPRPLRETIEEIYRWFRDSGMVQ